MSKKMILGVLGILIVAAGILLFMNLKGKDEKVVEGNGLLKNKKVLVVYFSAQNHTKEVANNIAKNVGAETFEIVPVNKYSEADLDWTNNNSRVSKENMSEELKDIELVSTEVDNWASYDVVFVGYPIWWGEAAWPINNFMKDNSFEGKIIIPFCTSASSSIGDSISALKDITKGGTWEDGKRFDSNATELEVKEWTDSLK